MSRRPRWAAAWAGAWLGRVVNGGPFMETTERPNPLTHLETADGRFRGRHRRRVRRRASRTRAGDTQNDELCARAAASSPCNGADHNGGYLRIAADQRWLQTVIRF